MSELDLGLKVASRRLLWAMGFSTRIDVPLRAYVPTRAGRGRTITRHETFTDLDVLGIAVSSGFALRTLISDCKTTQSGSTERMFWIRGVSDFFQADDAWMVRSQSVSAASRQLAARLGISVLEPADLYKIEEFHSMDLQLGNAPLALLFDEKQVGDYARAFATLDKRLDGLVEYRQFDFWVYDEYRNLLQVIAHLTEVNKNLDPSNPVHRALFLDCAWLYTLSLARAARNVIAVHVSDVDTSLKQYIFGGQMALQEKERLAVVLQSLAPKSAKLKGNQGVLPSWYPQLLDLLTRHLRRPMVINDELRYAEWAAEAQFAKEGSTVAQAFGKSFDPLAAKLLLDVCGFLVTVAELESGFRSFARAIFAQPGVNLRPVPESSTLAQEDLFSEQDVK